MKPTVFVMMQPRIAVGWAPSDVHMYCPPGAGHHYPMIDGDHVQKARVEDTQGAFEVFDVGAIPRTVERGLVPDQILTRQDREREALDLDLAGRDPEQRVAVDDEPGHGADATGSQLAQPSPTRSAASRGCRSASAAVSPMRRSGGCSGSCATVHALVCARL